VSGADRLILRSVRLPSVVAAAEEFRSNRGIQVETAPQGRNPRRDLNSSVDGVADVLLEHGRVAAIAPHGRLAGDAESIDADGRWLIPGLWDEHVHLSQWALSSRRLPLGEARSAGEVIAAVAAGLAGHPAAGVQFIGTGFRDAIWTDAPTRAALDAVSGDVPVVLVSHDVHSVWLNSAAASSFGVDAGESGLLREGLAFEVGQRIDDLNERGVDLLVERAAADAAALGVVGVVDFEMAWNVESWQRRVAAGFDRLRVEAAVYPPDLDRASGLGLATGSSLGGPATVGPLKVLIDGALNTRTAYCAHPYPDGTSGMLTVAPDELIALLRRARTTGFLPAVHAIGDAANRVALDAFEQVGIGGRIEHAQLLAPADLPRFAALGVTASVQPGHLLDDREVAEQHWTGRTDRAFPLGALQRAGARIVFGSDAPVARLDPWLAMRAAVQRAMPGESSWHPDQSLTPAQALAASSRGRTAIAVGEPADLVLLDDAPERASLDAQRRVAATLVAGRFTHRAF
jgi:predicted amidohydrolase YtcJ